MAANAPAKKCPPPGAPAWTATFADLMSLLLCFFVLLLSFSEMDIEKYKQIAGSMKMAFGVQRAVEAPSIPMGTTVISPDFSPGIPRPTLVQELRQQTTDETRRELGPKELDQEQQEDLEELARQIAAALAPEIQEGLLDVELVGDEIIIRIREKGSFASGSAQLQQSFLPILDKIGQVLADAPGSLIVAGYTDNIPISTVQFPSNWLLSAARAATVVHYLTELDPKLGTRMQIRAHGDTRPIAPNDTSENRALNRRVEIVIARPRVDEAGHDISGDDIDMPYQGLLPVLPETP